MRTTHPPTRHGPARHRSLAGRYTWYVYATDQAGRPQQNPIGHKTLTVK